VIERERTEFMDAIPFCVCDLMLDIDLVPSSFPEVYGNLPTKDQLSDWEATIAQHSALPEGVLVALLSLVIHITIIS
jgi:hypothetical protein